MARRSRGTVKRRLEAFFLLKNKGAPGAYCGWETVKAFSLYRQHERKEGIFEKVYLSDMRERVSK